MISSSEIKYFIEVARAQHMSRAAERLGVTQPALSHCIKRMEQEVGARLFIRSKKGVELTAAGQRFYAEAVALQEQWNQIIQSVHDEINAPKGMIRLGCHTAVAQYTLPLFLPGLVRDCPQIKIQLHHGLSRHVTEEVISSKLDVAIAVNPPAHVDLILKEICRDIVTLWRPHTCYNSKLLMIDPSLLQTQDILRKLAQKKIYFDNHLESASLEVIAQLLGAGAGHAILPQRVVNTLGAKNVEMVKSAPLFNDRVCLVFKPEFKKTKRGQIFIEAVTRAFA